MKCRRHPRYLGRNKPRCLCIDCWVVYIVYTLVLPGNWNTKRFRTMLRNARKKLGVTQKELSKMANLNAYSVGRLESGTMRCSEASALRLAETLKLKGDESAIFQYYGSYRTLRRKAIPVLLDSEIGMALMRKILREFAETVRENMEGDE